MAWQSPRSSTARSRLVVTPPGMEVTPGTEPEAQFHNSPNDQNCSIK